MHSTCLHCTKSLGANAVLETLPIGRRIAFDAATGRLWVVCRHCARWNLVPFDTRLETIDAGERLFHDTRTRFSTDNIGLARLTEGLELVRIGPALRPEFAAWRYGDSFGKRRRRNMVVAGGAVVLGVGVMAGASALGASVALLGQAPNWFNIVYNSSRPAIRIPRQGALPIEVSPMQASKAEIVPDHQHGWAVATEILKPGRRKWLRSPQKGSQFFTGDEARGLLAGILARTNLYAGSERHVREAVSAVEARQSLDQLIGGRDREQHGAWEVTNIRKMKASFRLALEMSLNEDTERKALEGELRLLEWQWREADRLAKIADDLVLEPEGEA